MVERILKTKENDKRENRIDYKYSPNRLQLSQKHAIRNLKECKIPCSCVKIFIKIFIFFLQQQSYLTYNIRYRKGRALYQDL